MIRSVFYFTLGSFPTGCIIMLVFPSTLLGIWTIICGIGLVASSIIKRRSI